MGHTLARRRPPRELSPLQSSRRPSRPCRQTPTRTRIFLADGKLHNAEPAPYTPAGGLGTNGSAPGYRVQSDFDYQSLALALYQEYIELDLFHWGLATFSVADFEAAGLTAEDRFLIQFMADQEVGHATVLTHMLGDQQAAPRQCAYNYPVSNVREYIDFNQKLTRFGESGVYGFLNHLDSREAAQLLLQSITTEARQQMIFRQFSGLFPMPPNPARVNGSAAWNETAGGYTNTLSTEGIPDAELCANQTAVGANCGPAITRNRTVPLSYPGREVFFSWDEPGKPVGPNNSYVTSTTAGPPQFAAWVTQLNVTYSPLLNVSGNSAYTVQPDVSTFAGDPAANETMFLAVTDTDLYVTPFNISMMDPHVYALALYQAK